MITYYFGATEPTIYENLMTIDAKSQKRGGLVAMEGEHWLVEMLCVENPKLKKRIEVLKF